MPAEKELKRLIRARMARTGDRDAVAVERPARPFGGPHITCGTECLGVLRPLMPDGASGAPGS
jgi:hypothetical protein